MKSRSCASLLGFLFVTFCLTSSPVLSQYSDAANRRNGIMNGNQVRTVFTNWGVIGYPDYLGGKRGAWKDDNNGYLGDVSPLVGAEVNWRGKTFHAVIPCPVSFRPQAPPRPEDPATGKQWAFEPLAGYLAGPPNTSVALSNNTKTWPTEWPDKMNDLTDPGWRGSWNGYFGKRASADLETYFVMDDNNFERFSDSLNNAQRIAFRPDNLRPDRKGLGLVMNVRALQWAQFLAQDNIFWLYEITNTGTTTYDRAVFGLLVGTYVGVTGQTGGNEYDDDWSFYSARDNLTYTGDYDRNTSRNALWNQKFPVGMIGYAFLESPGNPFDGIDNDGDADSSLVGRLAPQFTETSFDSTVIRPGQQIVLIRDDFSRVLFRVPNVDSVRVKTRGMPDSVWIYPGRTKLAEGNRLTDAAGNYFVNPNSTDGIDNNFNGLIDESYFLHYRQIKIDPQRHITLIDTLRQVRYRDYLTGTGSDPMGLIDERRDDQIDNDNDWSRTRPNGTFVLDPQGTYIDDVGRDGIQGTADFGERDGRATSGYDQNGLDTGLPGEPNIDKTDVNESDQIGLSSFLYFTPAGDVRLGDDEYLWAGLSPGRFDVPSNIVSNRPVYGTDGDFFFGSGFFPLLAGETERFSLALVYGGGKGISRENDILDLLLNKRTVQNIYDANYQFAVPPDKPALTVVPGDHQVTLYWDRKAENSIDPVIKTRDFEGYKIYKSTDPNFSDIFTVTDGSGTAKGYRPLKQFDVVDSVTGYFRATGDLFDAAAGYNIFLGDDTGLQHSFVDKEVDNGRTYYYAVVAYDKGSDNLRLFPTENTKQISISNTGEATGDVNIAIVVPNAKSAGYVQSPTDVPLTHEQRIGTGSVTYSVVDQNMLTGHHYSVTFLDTRVDGIDNNGNGLIDAADSTEWDRRTSSYLVKDDQDITETFTIADTLAVRLGKSSLVPTSIIVANQQGAVVPPSAYKVDAQLGTIRGSSPSSLPVGKYTITYQYYPVYRSNIIQGSPFAKETKDSDIFDGVQLSFNNDWSSNLIDSLSGWTGNKQIRYQFGRANQFVQPGVTEGIQGIRWPADYELRIANSIVDTSVANPDFFLIGDAIPVNFQIFNLTDNTHIKFYYYDEFTTRDGRISSGDQLIFLEKGPSGRYVPTWTVFFTDTSLNYNLTGGDKLVMRTYKPFREGDLLGFQPVLPRVDAAKATKQLDRVRVVPNPYVAAAGFEPPLPPGIQSGHRRKIDFIHLPAGATIKIFTSRGDHIVTLSQDGSIEDGTVSWNLRTKENLDIAYGIYFYVVESSVGNRTGKIAIIK